MFKSYGAPSSTPWPLGLSMQCERARLQVGGVLRDHGAIRSQLTKSGVKAWDAIMADVRRAYPGLDLDIGLRDCWGD